MAISVLHSIMNLSQTKTLHPFFTKPSRQKSVELGDSETATTSSDNVPSAEDLQASNRDRLFEKPHKNAQEQGNQDVQCSENIQTHDTQKSSPIDLSLEPHLDGNQATNNSRFPEQNPRRPKRRKISTEKTEAECGWFEQLQSAAQSGQVEGKADITPGVMHEGHEASAGPSPGRESFSTGPRDDEVATRGSYKKAKVLKLNSRGTLGSPQEDLKRKPELEQSPSRRKSRRRRVTKGTKVVVIRYGASDEAERERIGNEIEALMNRKIEEGRPAPAPAPAAASNPSKPTHPFFLSKTKENSSVNPAQGSTPQGPNESSSHKTTSRKSFITPVKLRAATHHLSHDIEETDTAARISINPQTKFKGTFEPPWPWQGFQWGRDSEILLAKNTPSVSPSSRLKSRQKKAKKQFTDETSVSDLTSRASTPPLGKARAHEQLPREASLQYPVRSIETRKGLQERANKLISTDLRVKDTADPTQVWRQNSNENLHPACEAVFERIGRTLSSFDRGECENESWSQKYAPRNAAHVLQPTNETAVLREWLAGLTVNAVENKIQQKPRSRSTSPQRANQPDQAARSRRKRRKRRRQEELDGFVVSSDEENNEMRDLDDRGIFGALNKHFQGSESVVRSGDQAIDGSDSRRVMNTILLSGPSGCGKTAAAYAVAQELGFSVFEINPSTKRSGKDVLDKVGDMSLNHQVKKADLEPSEPSTGLPLEPEARQNTLASFFSAKSTKSAPKKMNKKSTEIPTISKKLTKPQKQSLILLEEVDILFEDDKQFWETVINLAKQSRRPIIMTCNDESTLPLSTLSLHAILRFKPASDDLAAKYLTLVAAAEGHLVDTYGTEGLYQSTGGDLRASLMQLDYWCQMSVGSTKGGLDWYLKRWPIGRDFDSNGQQLHVVSNGTYRSGLGILGSGPEHRPDVDLALNAWFDFGLEPSTIASNCFSRLSASCPGLVRHAGRLDDYETLKSYAYCLDSLSTADTLRPIDYPSSTSSPSNNIQDPSATLLPEDACMNYTQDYPLLHDEPYHDYQGLSAQIYVSLCVGIRKFTEQSPDSTSTYSSIADELLSSITNRSLLNHQLESAKPDFAPLDPLISDIIDTAHPSPALASEVSPYARSIAAYDLALERQRAVLAQVHGDERAAKRLRTTRASRSALEGGARANTRRERWFDEDVEYASLLSTGGRDWPRVEPGLVESRQNLSAGGSDIGSREGSEDE